MRSIFKAFCSILIINLWACTIHNNKEERLSIEQCQVHCKEQFELCNCQCQNHCAHCTEVADDSMKCRYDKYVNEIAVQGQTIARELHSYRDPLQCRKVTCNCSADFNICYQACTGVIQKQLRAKPYCT